MLLALELNPPQFLATAATRPRSKHELTGKTWRLSLRIPWRRTNPSTLPHWQKSWETWMKHRRGVRTRKMSGYKADSVFQNMETGLTGCWRGAKWPTAGRCCWSFWIRVFWNGGGQSLRNPVSAPAPLDPPLHEAAAPLDVWTTSLESHYHGDAGRSDDSLLLGEKFHKKDTGGLPIRTQQQQILHFKEYLCCLTKLSLSSITHLNESIFLLVEKDFHSLNVPINTWKDTQAHSNAEDSGSILCLTLTVDKRMSLTKQDEEALRRDALQRQRWLINVRFTWRTSCLVSVCALWPLGLGWTPAAQSELQGEPFAERHEEETSTIREQPPSRDLRTRRLHLQQI